MNYSEGTSWQIAAVRAVINGAIVGGLAFLAMWATTDEAKTLIIAGVTPFLTTLATRLGIEGYVDRNNPTK